MHGILNTSDGSWLTKEIGHVADPRLGDSEGSH
jgi:hypothetical protein